MRDEVEIERRKTNVRKFGANWIRPPGVAKTLQARWEEEAEKKESLEQARREAVMQELLNAQEEVAARAAQPAAEEGAEDAEMERDLDAEVPDAEDEEDEEDDDDEVDDEEEDEDEDDDDGDGLPLPAPTGARTANRRSTFNPDDSLIHGSFVGADEGLAPGSTQNFLAAEDAELDGRAQDMRDFGVVGRDLDDDIPEAGSYEHTDTEYEESSDLDAEDQQLAQNNTLEEDTEEMDLESSFHAASRRRSRRGGRQSGGIPDALQQLQQQPSRNSFGAREESSRAEGSRDGSWLMRRLRGARRDRP
jgi:hypothetical protein